jgi:hypothetical protein
MFRRASHEPACSGDAVMPLSPEEREQRDRFFKTLLDTAISLQPGPDPEVTLEALLEASQMLTDHLRRELDELRQEQAE